MRSKLFKLSLLLCVLMSVSLGWSVVTDYSFASTTGTYTEISGGTVHGDNTNSEQVFNAVPIGFNFNYNGTVYDQVSITPKGFIAMGSTVTTSNTAISTGATNNVISVMNRDLVSRTDGQLMSLMAGTAPNRTFTVQWKKYRRDTTSTANDTLNFQLVLNETTNVIQFKYGYNKPVTYAVGATTQVGLRGAANTEYNNRMTTTNWTATNPGTANNSSCTINLTVFPPMGLTFTWTPVQAGQPPLPAAIGAPANLATNVSLTASISWLNGGGAPTGYRVFFGTNNPPTNIVNGTTQTTTSYNPEPDLAYNTLYYWQIVPYNEFGDAVGCPVWSFTTMPDPVVTTYPYSQNWDSATAPTVPNTWTVLNTNNDANTWVLVNTAGSAHSAPNAIRCSFNASAAMDDWFISPPLTFIDGMSYRVQFYYKAQSNTFPEKLEVKLGNAATAAALTIPVYSNTAITNTTYAMADVTVGPFTPGIYYLGWHGFSDANMFQIYVDDIVINAVVPVFNPPQNLTAASAVNSVVLSWQVPVESVPVGYKVFRDGSLITPTPVTTLNYTDTNVVLGTNYNYYVTAVYTNPTGESVPSNTVTGTPQEALIPPVALTATVNNYSAVLNWLAPGATPPGAVDESFENATFPPTDWAQVITDTGAANTLGVTPTWCRIGPLTISGQACTPTDGVWQAGMWWSTAHQDEWLKTPAFVCPANASLVFDSYVFLGSTNGDHYYVKVSTDNGATWTALWDASTLTGGWNYYVTPITISLSAYANQNIKLAWHADDPNTTNDGMWYTWFIDDAVVGSPTRTVTFKSSDMSLESAAGSQSYISNSNEFASRARALGLVTEEPVLRDLDRSLTGYKVYRNGTLVSTITNPATLTYTDTNLLPNTYSYTVTATYTGNLESPAAGPAQAIIVGIYNPPTALVGTATATNIGLTWTAPSPIVGNLAGYKVFRNGTLITPTPIAGTTYTDSAVTAGNTYIYYVTAAYTNPNGESAQSNSVSVDFGDNPDPVTDLAATVAQNDVTLTWVPPGGPILLDWINYDDGTNADGIGTGAVANFDVAARFTQTELTGLHDRAMVRVRFFPNEAACTYTLKIYTGATGYTNPGTLIMTVPVTNPTIGAWNEIDLPTPVQIPTTNEMWIVVNCNATTGYPAGCDDGPCNPYKSDLIFFNGAWDSLLHMTANNNPPIDINWNIQGLVTNQFGALEPIAAMRDNFPPAVRNTGTPKLSGLTGLQTSGRAATRDLDRSLTGYKVYRGGTLIATITDVLLSHYTDENLPNGTYSYTVTATYTGGLESPPAGPVSAVVDVIIVPTVLEDGFETYDNFELTFGRWMLNDVDQSDTYTMTGTTFANAGSPMAYIVFNPSATTPPMTTLSAHGGAKMVASIAATTPPNNDWMITPRLHLGTQNQVSFWAKSYTAQYGLERFKLGISTQANPLPNTFAFISGATYIEAPVEWTQFTYAIPTAYNNQNVRLGLQCVSNDAFIFFVDDFLVQGYNGYIGNDDNVVPVNTTELIGNYPNPFNPETIISYNVKSDSPVTLEVYNLKGQKVKTLVNGNTKAGSHDVSWNGTDDNGKKVTSGVYFYKMTAGKFSSSKKMILMK